MPRINQLPAASSVASTDVVAVDTENGTKRAPKSTLFDGYYTAAEVDEAISQSTAITSQTITMQSGFSIASWGGLTAYRVGNLLIVNGNGIKSSSVISTSTLFATVSNITFADNTVSTGRVDGTSDNIPIITALKGAGGRIQINNIKYADANIFFQLIALIE